MKRENDTPLLWNRMYGEEEGYLCLASGYRPHPGVKNDDFQHRYFEWPRGAEQALQWIAGEARRGREIYFCAHLLKKRRRLKEHAAAIACAYADGDEAQVPDHIPQPSIVVETSPGRYQYFWRLGRPVEPEEGERLNKRLAYAIGADKSGYDLTQLMRPPGTVNHKYDSRPTVMLLEISERVHDPDELARNLPPLHEEVNKQHRPTVERTSENGGRASGRASERRELSESQIRDLLRRAERFKTGPVFKKLFHAGEPDRYPSRSEARMALLGQLAFLFDRDVGTMVRVYKWSALWEKHPCEERRLWLDAQKAADNCTSPYDPNYRTNRDEREQLRLSLLSQAMELPWNHRGGPTDWAVYCSLINTGGEVGEVCAEGLIVYRSLTDLALDAGVSKPDTVSVSLDRLEEGQGLIRRLGRRTGREAERYLLLKPTSDRVIKINSSLSCVNQYIPLLCRFRNHPPETDKTHDKNGRRISHATGPLLNPFRKLQALIVAKLLYAGPEGQTHRQLAHSLGRRGNSLRGTALRPGPIPGLIEEEFGLLIYERGVYTVPEDIGERLRREQEREGCIEVETLQRDRDVKRRNECNWDSAYEEFREELRSGDPPPETSEAEITVLRVQGEAEVRAEAVSDEVATNATIHASLIGLERANPVVSQAPLSPDRLPSREELRRLWVDPDKERFYFPQRYEEETAEDEGVAA